MLNALKRTGRAVVVGAGTMGGGIAAHLANAGWSVTLLDVSAEQAAVGLERVKSARPPLLFLPELIGQIEAGSLDDAEGALAAADWVVEAVAERLEVKRAVLQRLEAQTGDDTVVTTNTSGLSLAEMCRDRSPAFRQRFLGAHFFNPPRYLKLLELIALPETSPDLVAGFAAFAETVLGRRIAVARDTPGFISNRVGMWTLIDSLHTAVEMGLSPEEVDAVTGPFIGRPRSATFRLADIIGFDIIADVAAHQYERLVDDPYRDRLQLPSVVTRLMADGRLGEKTGAGFFKRDGREILALDFDTLQYVPRRELHLTGMAELERLPLRERLVAVRSLDQPWARYLDAILGGVSTYVRKIGTGIAGDCLTIDHVMQWGFNWEMGPFEISDVMAYSPPDHYHIRKEGSQILYRVFGQEDLVQEPHRPEYAALNEAAQQAVLRQWPTATLVDVGDGAACLELRSKMNTLDEASTGIIHETLEITSGRFEGLLIAGAGPHFSAGFNLKVFLQEIEAGNWPRIQTLLADLQAAFQCLKYAPLPVVAMPHGYTLGGATELVLHCAASQASAELMIGLPETNVGLIPAGGGVTQMLLRAMGGAAPGLDPFDRVEWAFQRIFGFGMSANAPQAIQSGFLKPDDGVSLCADRQLFDAKCRVLALAREGWRPPHKARVRVLGEDAIARLGMTLHWRHRSGELTDHDLLIAQQVAFVLAGGALPSAQEVDEAYLLALEREAFVRLAHEPKTAERIRHTLETGKPLRN
ncbi:MAG: 3-hydroxyacyl-CoA dehydrogenase/enoyl-CoA hydratase family protein [Armatimonadetes bacterium]|nr:3-hydroxyacyl-CoA dehydrogenase/enoyl-CoA hydratase family protein [Armatimonadota bacterium]MDE2205512.1 3-hydroxyacyl-CoA dehydrogenase/enoyl-CoA hydratase family protein [Armatimonadota bacterium]